MAVHVYEFLYRGRPLDGAQEPGWHVILADDSVDAFGRAKLTLSDAMTPERAAALGFDLPTIIADINANLMEHHGALKTAHEALGAKHGELTIAHEALKRDGAAERQHLDQQIDMHQSQLAAAQAALGTAQAALSAAHAELDAAREEMAARATIADAPQPEK